MSFELSKIFNMTHKTNQQYVNALYKAENNSTITNSTVKHPNNPSKL